MNLRRSNLRRLVLLDLELLTLDPPQPWILR